MDDDIVSTICTIIFMVVVISAAVFLSRGKKGIGTNMQNETKNYLKIYEGRYYTYGVTEDGTRELLKSYKFNK